NTIPKLKGEAKAITTRSGMSYNEGIVISQSHKRRNERIDARRGKGKLELSLNKEKNLQRKNEMKYQMKTNPLPRLGEGIYTTKLDLPCGL
nr:hypothetical protein [Tanacetum cinerariifolium]